METPFGTGINDLPDGCLQEIFKRVGNASLPLSCPSKKDRLSSLCGVRHPLQCASVCRQWRTTAYDSVTSLVFSSSSSFDASSLVQNLPRFPQLWTLHLSGSTGGHDGDDSVDLSAADFLARLAAAAPRLADLALDVQGDWAHGIIPRGDLVRTLPAWHALCSLNLGRDLCPKLCPVNLQGLVPLLQLLRRTPTLRQLAVDLGPGSVNSLRAPTETMLWGTRETMVALEALEHVSSLKRLCVTFTACPHDVVFDKLCALTSVESLHMCARFAPPLSMAAIMLSLRSLDLAFMFEAEMPDTLGRVVRGLTSLSVRRAVRLMSLPDSIGDLSSLQRLRVYACHKLRGLPLTLGRLGGLESLSVESCKSLEVLPPCLGESLSGLLDLRLCDLQELKELPEGIGGLRRLTSLEVSWCARLRGVPESVGALRGLKSLCLLGCASVDRLPEAVCQLAGLEVLDVTSCAALAALPRDIWRLTELRVLSAYDCGSLHLSSCLAFLPALRKLTWGMEQREKRTQLLVLGHFVGVASPNKEWERCPASNALVIRALAGKGCEIHGVDMGEVRALLEWSDMCRAPARAQSAVSSPANSTLRTMPPSLRSWRPLRPSLLTWRWL